MNKQAPRLGSIVAMVAFALSCFGLLLFLWLAFGGATPLRPEGYRVEVAFPEAATLAQEADVRIAGVNVGKVKAKRLDEGARRTLVELEIDGKYAPIPKNTRAILRQKTLLGETYVELSPGKKQSGDLPDGGRLPDAQVEPTVELDEIFDAFDPETRKAFRDWMTELARVVEDGRGQDINDALGNLEGFAVDGARLLEVLDEQEGAVHRLVRNTGAVFGALNEQEGRLASLIQSSERTFQATASQSEALAETFAIFPTFLDESRATLARLESFSRDTRPLVRDLRGPADDLAPTMRDLGDLAPDLEGLFEDLDPVIDASERGAPALARFLSGAEPVLEAAHGFFPELNPILSYLNFHQATVAGFLSNGAGDLAGDFGGERYQTQVGMIELRGLQRMTTRPPYERGNAYLAPNALTRAIALGGIESFDCKPAGGEVKEPEDAPLPLTAGTPPCFVAPESLFDGRQFPRLERGKAPEVDAPGPLDGNKPADPNQR